MAIVLALAPQGPAVAAGPHQGYGMFIELIILAVLVAVVVIALRPPRK
jgi:hypothetical protein